MTDKDNDRSVDGGHQVGWFDALGNEVPREQRDAAAKEASKIGVDIPEDSRKSPWVNEVADLVERDRPKEAIETTRVHLDPTGTYRFLAALCVPVDAGTQEGVRLASEIEHPTPTCPNCGGNRTRPLDHRVAVCFDCDEEWRGDSDAE